MIVEEPRDDVERHCMVTGELPVSGYKRSKCLDTHDGELKLCLNLHVRT